MYNRDEINKLLRRVIWDYNLEPYTLFLISTGRQERIGYFDKEKALARIFEKLQWYELLDLYGMDFIKENITPGLIEKIRDKETRRKYEFLRKFLQGKIVPASGWDTAYNKTARFSFLSYRRNRS